MVGFAAVCNFLLMGRDPNRAVFAPDSELAFNFSIVDLHDWLPFSFKARGGF